MIIPLFISAVLGIFSFNVDKNQSDSNWTHIKSNLFINNQGQIGFASDISVANVPRSELGGETCANVFITTIGSDYTTSLNEVIDTATFETLGAEFYRDKNHLYHFYTMCEGGYLRIYSDDPSNFTLINDCYAQHFDAIYYARGSKLDADVSTFRASKRYNCLSRDKNGYFHYDERVSEEQLKEELGVLDFYALKKELAK